jgi:hypothetical protein
MTTKWEIITNYCDAHGLEKSTALAKEIQEALTKLYSEEQFKKVEIEEDDLVFDSHKEMSSFAGATDTCVACVTHGDYCARCFFGKEHGECLGDVQDKPLFLRFTDAFSEETGVKE